MEIGEYAGVERRGTVVRCAFEVTVQRGEELPERGIDVDVPGEFQSTRATDDGLERAWIIRQAAIDAQREFGLLLASIRRSHARPPCCRSPPARARPAESRTANARQDQA